MSTTFTLSNLIAILGALSIGALITALFQFWADKSKAKSEEMQKFKNERYKAVIILMNSILDFDQSAKTLRQQGRNFANKTELQYELLTEWRNMILFANDDVIKNLKDFLNEPSDYNFYKTSISMRKDLYGVSTKLKADNLI
jgi:hypothetical protein